ncbi:hypothetical protein M0813_25460 [Anaeramoeba flamelloides]|uniref:Uncharacterized protein n=1 Tax=Anaeramoeba flamelloides TaxID=1746091 RepID=A0ABQ8Y2P4_9EUKA|nr:hypothetical protein M0813_25460 [Anaeramoeba flamelloides]
MIKDDSVDPFNTTNHQIFPTPQYSNFPRYNKLGFERKDPNEENFGKEIHKKQEVHLTWIILFQKQFEETISSESWWEICSRKNNKNQPKNKRNPQPLCCELIWFTNN